MNILYIEDNLSSRDTLKKALETYKVSKIIFVNNFEDGIASILNDDVDFVITDHSLSNRNFSDYVQDYFGIPYFILSSSTDPTLFDWVQAPLGLFKKPLNKNHLIEIFESMAQTKQDPNMDYAEKITAGEPKLLGEMVGILNQQFLDAIEKIPYLYKNGDTEQLIQVVHKLIGKFSVLSMQDSFSFFNLTEKYLREGHVLKTYAYNRLLSDLKKGMDFINKYRENNELHNS